MVRSKQKKNEDVVDGVGVCWCECCWVLLELFWGRNGSWWEEEQSANGDWISLQNGTPKNPTPHFPNLMSLVAFLLCLLLLLLLFVCLFVCLSVYLFDCLSVFMSGWVVGWLVCLLKLFIFLFVWLFCMFVWMFDCLFALQWGRFHHPFCNFCKSQITVQNLDFVGGLLDGGIGV